MADRKSMDRPATAILAVSGLLLIGLSVPFVPTAYCNLEEHNPDLCGDVPDSKPVTFDVTWSAVSAADPAAVSVSAAPGTAQTQFNVTGVQGDVRVEVGSCADEFQDPIQEPAMVTVVLSSSAGGELIREEFECSEITPPVAFVYAQAPPGVARVEGLDDAQARRAVLNETAAQPTTVTYTLSLTATRGGTPAPVPLPTDPTLASSASVSVQRYEFDVNPRAPEVAK